METLFLKMFEAAAKVSNDWSFAAFAVAALVFLAYIFLKRRNLSAGIERLLRMVIIAVVFLASVPHFSRAYLQTHGVYRLRITVEDPMGMPVNDARVISSIGGEQKRIEGGWEIDIPSVNRPSDAKVTIYAEVRSAFLTGRTDLTLASDYSIACNVRLAQDRSAHVLGLVVNQNGSPVSGARVSIVGYDAEAVMTSSSGQFTLPAHAADGQAVQISITKDSAGSSQWVQAGEHPVTLVFSNERES